jgi:hypothetical protein
LPTKAPLQDTKECTVDTTRLITTTTLMQQQLKTHTAQMQMSLFQTTLLRKITWKNKT